MAEKREYLKCVECGEFKPDACRRLDPYALDILGIEDYVVICDDCEDLLDGDV